MEETAESYYADKENYMSTSEMGWDAPGKVSVVRSVCLE